MNKSFKKISIKLSFIFILLIILSGCTESKPKYNSIDPGNWEIREPSIFNNEIVWKDFRNDKSKADIYLYDLSKGKEKTIIIDDIDQTDIKIFDDKIIWRDGYIRIKMYDLINENVIELSTEFHNYNPEIFENKVVWRQDSQNGSKDIIMYDILTNSKLIISDNGSTPDIWKNYIVWLDISEPENLWVTYIYLYDIISNEKIPISTFRSFKFYPRVNGNKIIWADGRNAKSNDLEYDLYMYDLKKEKEIQITNSHSVNGNYNFDIYGNIIVWTDKRNDEGDIYIYDLSKNKEIPICTDEGLQCDPAIYENKIIWKDESGIGGRFVLYEIGNDETFIMGIKSTAFYLYMSPLIIILIIVILFFIWRRKKRKKIVKFEIENMEEEIYR